jgi:cyclase
MRNKILLVSTFIIGGFFTISAQDGGEKNEVKAIKVQKEIYMLQGKGGNIGLSIGNDGVFMIDDQFADVTSEILKDIKKLSKKPVQFLINTHHHGDHTGGNVNMSKEGAIIVSHDNVRKRLSDMLKNATEKSDALDAKMLPTITFEKDMNFHYNGEQIMVFHVHNAHTDGDAVVYFMGSNVIHTGDAMFNGGYPFIDTKNGGTLKGYIEGLEKISLLADDDTKIIPGHGDIATKKDVDYMVNMLNVLYKNVMFQYRNQKTEAEIVNSRDFTKPYDDKGFGNGFINTQKILQTIYNEVVREAGPLDTRTMEERLEEKVKESKQKGGSKG